MNAESLPASDLAAVAEASAGIARAHELYPGGDAASKLSRHVFLEGWCERAAYAGHKVTPADLDALSAGSVRTDASGVVRVKGPYDLWYPLAADGSRSSTGAPSYAVAACNLPSTTRDVTGPPTTPGERMTVIARFTTSRAGANRVVDFSVPGGAAALALDGGAELARTVAAALGNLDDRVLSVEVVLHDTRLDARAAPTAPREVMGTLAPVSGPSASAEDRVEAFARRMAERYRDTDTVPEEHVRLTWIPVSAHLLATAGMVDLAAPVTAEVAERVARGVYAKMTESDGSEFDTSSQRRRWVAWTTRALTLSGWDVIS